ncbi:unnamed protein product [Linum tenue]|uniref:TIR domain-containing protein n=1 Tax=Linum tenue TaxID=586396 RepID=A0AAV0H1S0_9ROSI|nr:unnamed protein product [Linum tenue]
MVEITVSTLRVMYNGKWEYDVFVCFRGADTRNSFTSHLMEALSREEIKAFIDDMLEKTESIGELISVLQRSALSIVIFSENFADSSWCLDEVATISQIMEEFGHRVLPIFYKVDPSDVSEDCGSYAATINLKYGASNVPEDRKRWMGALKAVANCTGHTSQEIKIDSELVKVIVSDVLKRLVHMSPRVKSDMLIGMDARICEVEKLLALNVNDFRIIGLWGMGGVGKTTLARACYQRFTSSTKGTKRQFVRNIHQTREKENGMVGIVQEHYSALLSEDNISYEDLDVSYRRDRLSRLKVFLVFDDVETFSELEHLLLGDLLNTFNLFALGSRIIVTTRNRRVLENARANIYYVEGLHSQESLQLFGIHAFRQYLPPDDWMRLSAVAISYCKGSPLAIKVLGGTLYCRDKSYWESFLCELRKIPKPEIHDVLRRSYDELGIVEKRLFLDTACFLHRQRKNLVMKYFSIGYQCANYVLEDLIGKSLLIRVSSEDYENIEVHDLLREMAWNIVNEESELANRSRLNNADDIRKILTIRKVKTEGISLNLFKANEMYLEATTFEGMTSLRFLCFVYFSEEHGIRKVHLPSGGLDMLPDSLRWLLWDGFPSKSLPSRFSPENLVLLAIRHSPFIERCWEVQQPKLVNLVELHLSDCINLTDVPDLSSSPNLEYLYLQGCKSLIELPSHIQYLNKLITLDLGDCINLHSLPVKLNSKFLEHVYLSNCPMVIRCPEINSRLVHLDLMETPVRLSQSCRVQFSM